MSLQSIQKHFNYTREVSYKNNPNKKAHTIIFSDLLADLVQGKIKAETLSNERYIHHDTRYYLRNAVKRLDSILLIFKSLIGDEGYQIMQEQLLNDDSALQVMGIKTAFLLMNNEQRDVAEQVLTVMSTLSFQGMMEVLDFATQKFAQENSKSSSNDHKAKRNS